MGEPTVVILNNPGDEHSSEDTAQIIQRALEERSHPTQQDGPLKQVLANQDGLYKHISWEEPARTLGTYLGALSILFGAHYLPLTQWTLKAAMTTLGVVSVTEFASRSFSSDSLSTRLRPKQYYTVDEAKLNAILRDIHDLIQSGVIQAQKILYGEDLEKAFGAFIGIGLLYGLAKVVSPFWLAVMALTSIFIAPLINSPRGRKVAQDAGARAQDLAKNGQVKASELSSKAQQAAYDAGNTVSNTAQNGKQAAADLTSRAIDSASDMSGSAAEKARNARTSISNATQNGKQTAADMTSKAKSTASDLSGSAADTARNAGQTISNTAQNGKQTAADMTSKAKGTAADLSGSAVDSARNAGQAVSNTAQNGKQTAADLSSKAQGTASGFSGAVADNTGDAGVKVSNAAQSGKQTAADLSSQATDKASNASGYAQGILSSAFGDAGHNSNDSTSQNYTHDFTHTSSHNSNRYSEGNHPRGQGEYETDGLASRASHSTHVGAEAPRLSAVDDVNRRAA
ncbi:Reticulon-like protein 1 Cwl1 [Colletotrichum graminicola]|nr:Reticulon-like protein 1 Cwl1 [Colletotrichum graminicola]